MCHVVERVALIFPYFTVFLVLLTFVNVLFFVLPWRNSEVDQGFLVVEDSWSFSDTPLSVELLWTSDQPYADTSTWQQIKHTRDIYYPRDIRTRNPSKPAVADPRLRPRGHWDRRECPIIKWKRKCNLCVKFFSYVFRSS